MRTIKFRAWNKKHKKMELEPEVPSPFANSKVNVCFKSDDLVFMQFTGLLDKNGTPIYEGDVIGEEDVYHFIEREGWKPSEGNWKIIGEKTKQFIHGKPEEKYIAGYKLTVVEWENESCGFEPFSDSQENCGHCGGGRSPECFEVLSNIYESPELLKEYRGV